jgi:hypothetical protein
VPLVPKGQDIYPADEKYAFHMVSVGDNSAAALTDLLPPDEEIFQHLEHFHADRKNNAEKAPDMLGLIFAALAVGMQIGVFDQNGCQWHQPSMAISHSKGEAWRKLSTFVLK